MLRPLLITCQMVSEEKSKCEYLFKEQLRESTVPLNFVSGLQQSYSMPYKGLYSVKKIAIYTLQLIAVCGTRESGTREKFTVILIDPTVLHFFLYIFGHTNMVYIWTHNVVSFKKKVGVER